MGEVLATSPAPTDMQGGVMLQAKHPQNPVLLFYHEAELENQYKLWHGQQILTVDQVSLFVLTVIWLVSGLLPPLNLLWSNPIGHLLIGMCLATLSWLVASDNRQRWFNVRERLWLGANLLGAASTVLLSPNTLQSLMGSRINRPIWFLRCIRVESLLIRSIILLITRLHWALPVHFVAWCWATATLPAICDLVQPAAPHACVLVSSVMQLLLGVGVPAALSWSLEKRSRENFLKKLQHQE